MAQTDASFSLAALRRGMLIVPSTRATQPASDAVRYAAVLELANLGFVAEPQKLEGLTAASLSKAIADARKLIGADREMTPIYPGFPQQVEELPTLTLLVEQLLHYWTGGTFLPNYPTVVREGLPLEDMLRNARSIWTLSAADAAGELIDELVGESIALSADDRVLLIGAVALRYSSAELRDRASESAESIAKTIRSSSNGENIQVFVEAVLMQLDPSSGLSNDAVFEAAIRSVRSADHLLRIVLSVYTKPSAPRWQANYDLAVGTLADRHFRAVRHLNIPRFLRVAIMDRLGELSHDFHADRILARVNLWRGVLRTIHPYDLALSKHGRRAADIIHGNIEYRTLNSLVEEGLEQGETGLVAQLLAQYQPGNLLRRLVAILRLTKDDGDAAKLAAAVELVGKNAALTTLISAYNGVLAANDEHARVTRVAGLTNTMQDRSGAAKVDPGYQAALLGALDESMVAVLSSKTAPHGPVGIGSTQPVPLVRRDAASADRVLNRGEELALAGEGDTLRIFGHWRNNQRSGGYMDIGAVVLDGNFKQVAVSTWNSWQSARDWSTYSGDRHVSPGESAPEFIDLKLKELRRLFPAARWVAMTIQSWSGFPIEDVDLIAGAMLRSEGQKGAVFDPRSVTTAFKPTTRSTQAVPFAVNLETGSIVWIDSSNGSTASGVSAIEDDTVGPIVYDEIARPRLTLGQFAELWARAHGAATADAPVDEDRLLGFL